MDYYFTLDLWKKFLIFLGLVFQLYTIQTVGFPPLLPFFFLNIVNIPFLRKRRIQEKMPSRRQVIYEVKFYLLSLFVFTVIAGVFLFFFPLYRIIVVTFDLATPFYVILAQFIAVILLHDTYFYWTHRMMHHTKLYRWVHLVHHKSVNPTPLASYSFHPWETLVHSAFFPLFLLVWGLTFGKIHILAVVAWLIYYPTMNVYGHLGIEIMPRWFVRSKFTKWFATSVHHNLHHHKNRGHYGLYFTFWDRICGTTMPEYETEFEKVHDRRIKTSLEVTI